MAMQWRQKAWKIRVEPLLRWCDALQLHFKAHTHLELPFSQCSFVCVDFEMRRVVLLEPIRKSDRVAGFVGYALLCRTVTSIKKAKKMNNLVCIGFCRSRGKCSSSTASAPIIFSMLQALS